MKWCVTKVRTARFATAIKREKGVGRILFRERKLSVHYARLFTKLDAVDTRRVVDGIPEWEWTL